VNESVWVCASESNNKFNTRKRKKTSYEEKRGKKES
jgi:hypothetical protein